MAAPAPAPAAKITGLEAPMVVVGPQFCVPYDVELIVTEKAISLDDASSEVKDSNGNVMLKLKGRLLGIHKKRWLCDASGVRIVTMQEKLRSIHGRWNMYKGDSTSEKDLICTIKNPSLITFKAPEYHLFFAGNTSSEQTCDIKIKKGYNNQQMGFYLGNTDQVVAQMSIRQNLKTKLLEQDSYGLTVYANMDYALVVALTSILDAARDAEGK